MLRALLEGLLGHETCIKWLGVGQAHTGRDLLQHVDIRIMMQCLGAENSTSDQIAAGEYMPDIYVFPTVEQEGTLS